MPKTRRAGRKNQVRRLRQNYERTADRYSFIVDKNYCDPEYELLFANASKVTCKIVWLKQLIPIDADVTPYRPASILSHEDHRAVQSTTTVNHALINSGGNIGDISRSSILNLHIKITSSLMRPREFHNLITPAPSIPLDLSQRFCQKACEFANNNTRTTLCSFCYYPLSAEERLQYNYAIKHRLIIGESIGYACYCCGNRLSSTRISDECSEFSQRYLDYWLRSANFPTNQDGNIVIPIVYSEKDSTDTESED
ncbi:hypothetical protein EAG_05437 [Camponotus floridanus]|uniref:Uncharacterized protein n=1 Tax=Camponotus floridanus TaxID=104421 RepID=E2AYA3_CAMFO|nr:hypothetical protein EAG_05437 [Camponotus floridanus]